MKLVMYLHLLSHILTKTDVFQKYTCIIVVMLFRCFHSHNLERSFKWNSNNCNNMGRFNEFWSSVKRDLCSISGAGLLFTQTGMHAHSQSNFHRWSYICLDKKDSPPRGRKRGLAINHFTLRVGKSQLIQSPNFQKRPIFYFLYD